MPSLPFDTLSHQPEDPLLALIGEFRDDSRSHKVDLGVGIYRDADGRTPVMRAVKAAERLLVETQATKAYVGPTGDLGFLDLLWDLVGEEAVARDRVAALQTVGGSGALRIAADLLHRAGCRSIVVGTPTWLNHAGIFAAAGLKQDEHRFFDVETQAVLFDAIMEALEAASPGDAVLLHACCHNPTGATLSPDQWRAVADLIAVRGLVPLIDVAYFGLGQGPADDGAGLRCVLSRVPEALVAVSASKSFGLYRERTGALFAIAASARSAAAVRSHLQGLARTAYSMPPDHGAAVVRTILADGNLKAAWLEELDTMRERIAGLRHRMADACRSIIPALAAVAEQHGMFSLLALTPEAVRSLKRDAAIYMPESGRINIAGLREADVVAVMTSITPHLRQRSAVLQAADDDRLNTQASFLAAE